MVATEAYYLRWLPQILMLRLCEFLEEFYEGFKSEKGYYDEISSEQN